MSTLPDIDDAQAEVIDQRIGQTFAFLRDVLANPALVEKIPTGATLRHRDMALDGVSVVVRLTAYRTPAMATWSAIVSGVDGTPPQWAQAGRWHMHDPYAWHVHLPNKKRITFDATGETPDAALDALEAEVRRAAEVAALPG